jgi:hypothetical protein
MFRANSLQTLDKLPAFRLDLDGHGSQRLALARFSPLLRCDFQTILISAGYARCAVPPLHEDSWHNDQTEVSAADR